MPDLAVSNDTEIIAKVQKTAEILMIFKVHTYREQTVVSRLSSGPMQSNIAHIRLSARPHPAVESVVRWSTHRGLLQCMRALVLKLYVEIT